MLTNYKRSGTKLSGKKLLPLFFAAFALFAVFNACKKDSSSNIGEPKTAGTQELQKIVPPGGCQYYNYPLLYYPQLNSVVSPASTSFIDVKNFYDQTDPSCDYVEYTYSGTNWTGMMGITSQGTTAIGPHPIGNDPWGFRVRIDGAYTKVFVPKSFVYSWFSPTQHDLNSFNDNVRLCRPGVGNPCPTCPPPEPRTN